MQLVTAHFKNYKLGGKHFSSKFAWKIACRIQLLMDHQPASEVTNGIEFAAWITVSAMGPVKRSRNGRPRESRLPAPFHLLSTGYRLSRETSQLHRSTRRYVRQRGVLRHALTIKESGSVKP
ncbi:hypothetical protein QCE62_27840 [Caballeronia sp. LZ033]|uniref:hypothetical protein n=1 Tax=Caballeronia sp. LZ033 TaxID=3038566 RepID=UPI00285C5B29|nr:hypothetical protein [Caballeronia sp. LZ033]MDR5817421.1 hypothetical protein [Caballeronia sp. LZ033]